MFVAHLTADELVDFRSLRGFSRTNPIYGDLCHKLLECGFILSPRGIFGCLSTPMREAELDALVDALGRALNELTRGECVVVKLSLECSPRLVAAQLVVVK